MLYWVSGSGRTAPGHAYRSLRPGSAVPLLRLRSWIRARFQNQNLEWSGSVKARCGQIANCAKQLRQVGYESPHKLASENNDH